MVRDGSLVRVARGLYRLPDVDVTEHHTLVQVAKRVPHGVICLLSALRFHDVGTQSPLRVWTAVDTKARRPKAGHLPVRFVRFSGAAFTAGVERHVLEGVPVRVYSIPKTIADCFKYRNKIGLDVALEALEDCRARRRCTVDDLWYFAHLCRVANVMRPYLEAVR
jgi:predicted transcriptional regulator of viral defense system